MATPSPALSTPVSHTSISAGSGGAARRPVAADATLEADTSKVVDDAVSAFLAAADVEVPDVDAPVGKASPPKPAEAEPEAPADPEEPDAADEPDEPDEPAEPAPEPASRAAVALLRREAEATKRAKGLDERERALKTREAELDARGAGPAPDVRQLASIAARDPVGFYTQLVGKDKLAEYGRVLLAEAMGDKAPEQYRNLRAQMNERTAVDQRIADLDRRQAEFEQRQRAAAAASALDTEARAVTPASEAHKALFAACPSAARFAAKNPSYFAREIVNEIVSDARARAATEGMRAEAIEPAEAVRRIERRLASYGFEAATAPSKNDTAAKTGTVSKKMALQTRVPKQVQDDDDYDAIVDSAKSAFLSRKD